MNKLDVQVYLPRQIESEMIQVWNRLRASNPSLSSPFFHFDFIRAAEKIGRKVSVAVIRQKDEIVGFLPYEKKHGHIARPVACQMNDAHGIIGREFSSREILAILNACEIKSFDFHSWFGSEKGIKSFAFAEVQCTAAKLSYQNDEQSLRSQLQKKSYTIRQQIRKTRKLVRDHGPISYQNHCCDPEILETLFRWKSQQYHQQNTFDLLSLDWTKDLLRTLFGNNPSSGLKGILSVLRCDGKPVAIHFGLQEGSILHYWFPVFNQDFRQQSPGTELFLQVADFLEANTDIKTIDMGYGNQPYKTKLINHHYFGFKGKIIPGILGWNLAKTQYQGRETLRQIPLKGTIRKIIRKVSPNFGGWLYE